MNHAMMQKLVSSGLIVGAIQLLFYILKFYARQTQQKFGIRKSRYFATKRILTLASLLLSLLVLILIWDVNLKHVWISATGILAMIAIAFFAVWSLIGNILAGVLIYFTSPFKIEDTIEVMPDEIKGTVLAINTFYTVLLDADNNYINVPNSLFFQKYIQVLRKKKTGEHAAPPPSDETSLERK